MVKDRDPRHDHSAINDIRQSTPQPCPDCPRALHRRPDRSPLHEHSNFPHRTYSQFVATVPVYRPGDVRLPLPLSGVVVVTNRSRTLARPGLRLAKRIAERHGAVLLIIRSGQAAKDRPAQHLITNGAHPVVVIDLPLARPAKLVALLPDMQSDRHAVVRRFRSGPGQQHDAARKRNLALAFGRLCGWDTLLLLDDDMMAVPPTNGELNTNDVDPYGDVLHLDHALADMAVDQRVHAIGYDTITYPDHSVVGHARRALHGPQPSFLGAGALLLRCGAKLPFFPGGYNDDWMFQYALMLDGLGQLPSHAVKWGGSVFQQIYQPFTPKRAMSEELGDLMAEQLMADAAAPIEESMGAGSTAAYWQVAGQRRQEEILDLVRDPRLNEVDPSRRIYHSLLAALSVYTQVQEWATLCAEYIAAWEDDLEQWQRTLARLTPVAGSDARRAIATLGIQGNTTWLGGHPGTLTALRGRRG